MNFSEEKIDDELGGWIKGSNMRKWDCFFPRDVLKDLKGKMVFKGES